MSLINHSQEKVAKISKKNLSFLKIAKSLDFFKMNKQSKSKISWISISILVLTLIIFSSANVKALAGCDGGLFANTNGTIKEI